VCYQDAYIFTRSAVNRTNSSIISYIALHCDSRRTSRKLTIIAATTNVVCGKRRVICEGCYISILAAAGGINIGDLRTKMLILQGEIGSRF